MQHSSSGTPWPRVFAPVPSSSSSGDATQGLRPPWGDRWCGGCLQLGSLRIDQAGRTVTLSGSEVALGRREFDLLEFLLLHPSRVFSRDQLVEQLYGWDGDVESNVIEVHVHHLRRKFGTGVVKTVRGVGYRLGELT